MLGISAVESETFIVLLVPARFDESKVGIEKGYKAGLLVKNAASVLLGGGGGRDEIASGSGRDASKVNDAIKAIKELVK